MVTALQAINWHNQFLGKRDNGGSFIWKLVIPKFGFAAWYDGLAYCGATELALCDQLGLDTYPMTNPKRLVYVPWVVEDAKKAKKWRRPEQLQPGDWCVNDWPPADGAGDHITMVIKNDPARRLITIVGGNHRDGISSKDRGVFIRTWNYADVMGGVDRQHAYSKTVAEPKWNKLTEDGLLGPNTIRAWQRYNKTPEDGVLSNPSTMVTKVQADLNRIYKLNPSLDSGVLDFMTETVLMRHYGSLTRKGWVTNLQRQLNAWGAKL